jgi:cytochrome P450
MLDQDLQAKLHEELDSVIGSDRLITMDDKPNLHYTSAVVNVRLVVKIITTLKLFLRFLKLQEIQRIANLVPMNVRHATTRDVTINGYFIPKGTSIIPQLSVVLYDDKV